MVIIFQEPPMNDHYLPNLFPKNPAYGGPYKDYTQKLYTRSIRWRIMIRNYVSGANAGVIYGNHRAEVSYGADWPGTILCGLVPAARILPGCSRSRRRPGQQGGSARRKRTPSVRPLRKSDRLQGIPTSISLPDNIPLLSPGDETTR